MHFVDGDLANLHYVGLIITDLNLLNHPDHAFKVDWTDPKKAASDAESALRDTQNIEYVELRRPPRKVRFFPIRSVLRGRRSAL